MARNNICNCPNPPGGQVVCEPHQMAVCIVRNGQARQQCLDPIRTRDSATLVNWVLEEITENRRNPHSRIDRHELEILEDGFFNRYDSKVTFKLPQRIVDAIEEIKNGGKNLNDREEGLVTI